MPSVNAKIAALKKLAAQAAAERERYAPYSEVRIRSIAHDKADVVYWPRGKYGTDEKTDGLTVSYYSSIKKAKSEQHGKLGFAIV